MRSRPLGRSLEPLPDEDLGGYLLRLSAHLSMPPMGLARHLGLISSGSSHFSRRLLFTTDLSSFSSATRMTIDEARALTLVEWGRRYPPIFRSMQPSARGFGSSDLWMFSYPARHCPQCLKGDSTEVQRRYGGAWRKSWRLPITFACLEHGVYLRDGCGEPHAKRFAAPPLIASSAVSTLHPTQCREPRPGSHGRGTVACGARLDGFSSDPTEQVSEDHRDTQRRIFDHLLPGHDATESNRFFKDLRAATSLVYPGNHKLPATSRETAAVLTAAIGMVDGRNQNDEIDPGSPADSSLGRTDDRRLQPDAAGPSAAPTGIELLTARYATGEDAQAWRERGVTMTPQDAVEAALADSALPGALALAAIEILRGLHAELDAMDARVAEILEGSVPYPEIGIALGGVTRQSAKAWIQSRLTRIPDTGEQ